MNYAEAEAAEYARLAAITETKRLASLFRSCVNAPVFHDALMELSFEDRMAIVDKGWTRCPWGTYKASPLAVAKVR